MENPNTFALLHVALVVCLLAGSVVVLYFVRARFLKNSHESTARVDAILHDIDNDRNSPRH